MDYNELLFAAAVRELAGSIKHSNAGAYWESLADDPERTAKRTAWLAEHPLTEFVPEALARIKQVAEIIRTLE
jgi:hypothetical protein